MKLFVFLSLDYAEQTCRDTDTEETGQLSVCAHHSHPVRYTAVLVCSLCWFALTV